MFADFEKYPLVPTQICLENLERLHLIEINLKIEIEMQESNIKSSKITAKSWFYSSLKKIRMHCLPKEYEVVYKEFIIEIRGFGQFFARACLGEDFHNIE